VRVPRLPASLKNTLSALYHTPHAAMDALTFDEHAIAGAGIYQLSKLRLECMSLAKSIMHDLKNDELKPREHYETLFQQEAPEHPAIVSVAA
jgi:hypothetical protein